MKLRRLVLLAAVACLGLGCFAQNVDVNTLGDQPSVGVVRAATLASDGTHANASDSFDGFKVGPNFVTIRVIRDGNVISEQVNHNLKTTGGVDAIFGMLLTTSTQPAASNYIYLSSDTGSPAAGDCGAGSSTCTLTGVLTTNGMAPARATFTHTSGTSTATLTYTWTASTAGTSNIQKAAVSNSVTPGSGTVVFENTFTPVSLNVGDQLQITWTITIS